MALFDSGMHQWMRGVMQLTKVANHMQADALQAMCKYTVMGPALEATYGHLNDNPLRMTFSGVRKMASLHPLFSSMAARFPDSITYQFGIGKDGAATSRGFDNVNLAIDPTRPDLFHRGAALVQDLNSKEHQPVAYQDLLEAPVIDGETADVQVKTAIESPFQNLTRISSTAAEDNKVVYLSAPMSGHFSTLASKPVQNYLNAGYTVYLRDLKDAANEPLQNGVFGMEEQVRDFIDHMQYIHQREGRAAQVSAICQGSIPVVIGSAYMAKHNAPYKPEKLFITSAPIDVSVTQSPVNKFAEEMSETDFSVRETTVVPFGKPGAGRLVRAGRSQVGAFKGANPGMHMAGEFSLANAVAGGQVNWEKYLELDRQAILDAIRDGKMSKVEETFAKELEFRIEYHTEADHDAASYVDAGTKNFLGNFLMAGTATYDGETIDLKDLDMPILAVDAGRDNISAPGQTMGIFQATNDQLDARAMLVEGKGHFWWGGESSRKSHWPQILAWHSA
ncbi:MAG: hypothetical protein AB8B83_02245, partial [Bdellovibrionales bacterium]